MTATHVIQISFKSGNGVEVGTTQEHVDKLLVAFKAYRAWEDKVDLDNAVDNWYTLEGATKSRKPTLTVIDLSNIELINIAELPGDLALPTRPQLS